MRKKIGSARVWRWLFSLPLMAGLLFGALPSKAPAAVTGQVRISLSSSAPAPGSTVTATVAFSSSSPILGVNTTISISTSIVESFEVINGSDTRSSKDNSSVRLIFESGNMDGSASGTLATIRMKIRSDAPAGGAGSLQVIMAEGSGKDPATGKLTETIQMNRGSAGMTVTVPKSSNANLSSLKVNGQEVSGTGYKITVPYGTSSATISATPQDSKARVSGTGTKSLSVGTNKFTVTVTAENGASKGYTVTVVREARQNTVTSAQPKPNTSSSRPSPVSSGEVSSGDASGGSSADSSEDSSDSSSEDSSDSSEETSAETSELSSEMDPVSSNEEDGEGRKLSLSDTAVHVLYIAGMVLCLAGGAMLGYFIRGKQDGE